MNFKNRGLKIELDNAIFLIKKKMIAIMNTKASNPSHPGLVVEFTRIIDVNNPQAGTLINPTNTLRIWRINSFSSIDVETKYIGSNTNSYIASKNNAALISTANNNTNIEIIIETDMLDWIWPL